jgi:hypothetical protein
LLSSTAASAQPTFRLGVRAGGNRALTTEDAASTSTGTYPYSYTADKSAIYSWQAGAVLEIAFRHFALQPALLFSQKGEEFHTQQFTSGVAGTNTLDTRRTSRPNWLEMPLNAVYTVHEVQLFAGPYVAVALGGQEHYTGKFTSPFPVVGPDEYAYSGKLRYGADSENRRLDAGLNFGVGYQHGPLQVQLGYGLGLRNLHQKSNIEYINDSPPYNTHNFNSDAAYNRVVQLTGTYFFEL